MREPTDLEREDARIEAMEYAATRRARFTYDDPENRATGGLRDDDDTSTRDDE